ncbi:resolvase [Sphingomonas sp. MM-1]|uniref:recombinase family protein n=1 Tax=Sphingomonas sp. MM-1 TaxID=745310 RepID=UPI0002C05425|nr:recombinase family protein [Sphingomonas sp. MM-1]AGH51411.1 resolvase [Sphingomonas sp. MM-1]
MTRDIRQRAVIYCRVSDAKQKIRGDGLGSQETIGREYADRMGYEVVKVFRDDFTGKSANRAGMKELLAFLKGSKGQTIVIVDDLNRLARSLRTHYAIRDAIATAGGKLVSPKREFADDPDDDLLEIIEAAFAGEHRRKNAEQTLNRMRGRAMNGYWVFQAPLGYRYEKAAGGGKALVRVEPMASIIKEGLEGYASGRFDSQAEVKRFFESNPLFPKDRRGLVSNERVHQVLTQPLYAGYLEVPRWKLALREARHEGLISLETFDLIQDRLTGKARAPSRKDINADFPLRGFVACGDCNHPMTATWAKGVGGRYAYYMCRQHECSSKGKSIARAKVEGGLESLIRSLTPSRELVHLASTVFRNLWDRRAKETKEQRAALKLETVAVEKKIGQFLDRIVEAENPTVVSAYENKVGELEREKLILAEKITKCGTPARDYDDVFQTSMAFLANPWNLWETGELEDRRAMLKLVFTGHLTYDRKTGFQTPEISLPFKALEEISGSKKEMVHPRGFEPLASAFGELKQGPRHGSLIYLDLR